MGAFLSVAVALWATDMQVDARCEVQGGQAPLTPGEGGEAQVGSILQSDVALLLRDDTGLTRIHYLPRLTFRHPNLAGELRPLLLHSMGARHQAHASRRLDWEGEVESSVGDLDYLALGALLPGQAALPAVSRIFTLQGGFTVAGQATRLWRLEGRLGAAHRRALATDTEGTPAPGTVVFPDQTEVTLDPVSTLSVTRRDALIVRAGLTFYSFATGLDVLAWQPRAAWRRWLTRDHELTAGAGAALVAVLQEPTAGADLSPVGPLAEVALTSLLLRHPGLAVGTRLRTDVSWILDPVLIAAVTRGTASARVSVLVGRDLAITPETTFATHLSRDPLPGAPDETLVTATLPVSIRLSRHLALEVGGRYAERRPHLDASAADVAGRERQRELWGYVMLVASVATFHPLGADEPAPALR